MPKLTMRNAWLAGFVILSIPFGAFLIIALAHRFHVLDRPLLQAADEFLAIWISVGPGIAGFMTAMLAPREKFLAGLSLMIANTALVVGYNNVSEVFGLWNDLHGF